MKPETILPLEARSSIRTATGSPWPKIPVSSVLSSPYRAISTSSSPSGRRFVAGDLLWYAQQGDPTERLAPDAMVVFGRPKGDRGSYKQWEEDGIAPQVVWEVLSPGNTTAR